MAAFPWSRLESDSRVPRPPQACKRDAFCDSRHSQFTLQVRSYAGSNRRDFPEHVRTGVDRDDWEEVEPGDAIRLIGERSVFGIAYKSYSIARSINNNRLTHVGYHEHTHRGRRNRRWIFLGRVQ